MKSKINLITDKDLLHSQVREYNALGYFPTPTGGETGRQWLKDDRGLEVWHAKEDGTMPTEQEILGAFYDNPGCGISLGLPTLRNNTNNLLAIDCDLEDDADTIRVISLIINFPCPVKFGSKGGTFFVRYPAQKTIPQILKERNINVPRWATASKLSFVRQDKNNPVHAIDFLGIAGTNAHTVLPPTQSLRATEKFKEPSFYRWISWPLSPNATPLQLNKTPPQNLPELTEADLLLIYQWAKNPNTALWQYIGQSEPGSHHALMLAATMYMWHEKFTQDEIIEICTLEAERSSESEENLKLRLKEINTAVSVLPKRAPEQKPSSTRNPTRLAKAKEPTLDRVMCDHLIEKYENDNLAYFTSVPFYWDGEHWQTLYEKHIFPWAKTYRYLFDSFPEANDAKTSAAIRAFSQTIPIRTPQPNPWIVPFKNGVLDLQAEVLRPEERSDNIPAVLDCDYDSNAICPLWEKFITNLFVPPAEHDGDPDDHQKAVNLVEEFFGYCLVRNHSFQKMLFVVGPTGRGKSVLTKVLQGLLPPGWVTHVALENFEDPNCLVQMVQANVNIAAEIGRKDKNVDAALLKITAGEAVQVKLLYQNKSDEVLPARLVFQGNIAPDTTDVTGAIERRMMVVHTTDVMPPQIAEYEKRLLAEKSGILARLVKAYQRLMLRGDFERPAYSIEEGKQITRQSNSVTNWVDECCDIVTDMKEGSYSPDLYDHYFAWCDRNKMFKHSSVQWGKLLTQIGHSAIKKRVAGGHVVKYRALKLKTNLSGYGEKF